MTLNNVSTFSLHTLQKISSAQFIPLSVQQQLTTMSFVERLRNNDPELKDLRLTEEHQAYALNVNELADSLKNNEVVDFIRLDRDFLPSMTIDEIGVFFRALGEIPNLQEGMYILVDIGCRCLWHSLKLFVASIWHASAPVSVLADFVSAAKKLKTLHLGCINLVGAPDDFKNVSEALKTCSTLKVFNLTDFSLNDDSANIDSLVEALGELPALTGVKLEATHAKRSSLVGSVAAEKQVKVSVGGQSLSRLMNSKTLEEIQLSRIVLSNEDFEMIASAIETSPALKGIYLPHCQINDDVCSRLAVAFGKSSKLEEVDLSCNKITDEGCIAIATILKQHSSVKYLRLWGNIKISNAGFDALVDMMESNCVLERVPLMMPLDTKARIDARLVQNRSATNQAA